MAAASLPRQLALLGHARGFRLLFLATLGSGIGTWLAFVALTVDVYDRTGSGAWVGALLIADFAPMVVIGLTLGPIVDRVSRRALMIGSDLARLAIFAVLPFAPNAATIVALAGVAGFATGFFRPAVYAGLPNVVGEDDLARANSLFQTVENITTTAAPLAGGAIVALSGPDIAYWLNAVTFLVSALLLARIPGRLLQAEAVESRGHLRDLAEGFALVRRSRALFTVLVAWNVAMFAIGATNVSEVFLAKDSLDSGDFGFGLLVATAGLGLAVGSFSTGSLIGRYRIAHVYGVSLALMAVGYGAAAVSPNVWVAAVCVTIYGAGNGCAVVCNALFVQRGAPDRLRGRAFTVLMSSTGATLAVAMLAGGWLTDGVGARWIWGIAAAIAAVAAALGYSLARTASLERQEDDALAAELAADAPRVSREQPA